MKAKHIFFFGITVAVAIIFIYALTDTKTEQDYASTLQEARKERDEAMKKGKESPIQDKENFEGLNYYEPKPNFRLKAKVEKVESKKTFKITRTDDEVVTFTVFAYLNFTWQNKTYQLLAFNTAEDPNTLFIPFGDESNGKETYDGGRYLNLKKTDEEDIILDFNLAFNPNCVYDDNYACPIPPKENFLDFAVEAGEKMYKKPLKEEDTAKN